MIFDPPMSDIPESLNKWLSEELAKAYLKTEDEAILNGIQHVEETGPYKYTVHGIGYNSHYSAVMAFFSSHQLNVLKHNGIYVYQHTPINRSKLFNFGIGIGNKLKRKLVFANQIGLIKLV